MLIPQVLEGVAAVGLLCAAVRRWFGNWAGIAAGVLLALTPVFALMFRFNNPDALLTLTLVASAYSLTRALERADTRWVPRRCIDWIRLPGEDGTSLSSPSGICPRLHSRSTRDATYEAAPVARWWLRNSCQRRLVGRTRRAVACRLQANHRRIPRQQHLQPHHRLQRAISDLRERRSGWRWRRRLQWPRRATSLIRQLDGWPSLMVATAVAARFFLGIWSRGRAPRTDRVRAALILWGSWLLVTAVVFSFSGGVIHTYYTVALAPAIAALVAIGGAMLLKGREQARVRLIAGLGILGSLRGLTCFFERTPNWNPWLRPLIAVLAVTSVGLLLSIRHRGMSQRVVLLLAAIGPPRSSSDQ